MGSAFGEHATIQANLYPGHKQNLQQSIHNNSSQHNLSSNHIHGPGSATSFHANTNTHAKAKLFKQQAKNAVLANQLSNYSTNG